jgi:PPM family protein phosphatase
MLEVQSAALTDSGCVRKKNEDRISLHPSRGMFVVVDGMGGEHCGDLAADRATQAVEEYLQIEEAPTPAWPFEYEQTLTKSQNIVMNVIKLANYRVWETSQKLQDCQGMGATMSLLRIRDDLATVGNIGDSRVYISRGSVFQQLTRDDSVVSNLIDQGQITREEARTHPMRNVLTLALGLAEDVPVQLVEFQLKAGDRFLLSSDGLHGSVDDDELGQLLRSESDPELTAKALVAAALERGGPDNISCIVIHCR